MRTVYMEDDSKMRSSIKRNVYHTMRLLTATTQMKDSCTSSNMNIHDFRDENDETICAGFVFPLKICRLWNLDDHEFTAPPQRTRRHRI